jgi:hypothetical protein
VFHLESLAKEVNSSTNMKKLGADVKGVGVKATPQDPAPTTEPKTEPKREPKTESKTEGKTEVKTDTTTRDSKTDAVVPGVTPPQLSLREIVQRGSNELRERGDLSNARRILSTVFSTNASTWERQRVFNTLDSRINSASEQDLRMVKQLLGIQ